MPGSNAVAVEGPVSIAIRPLAGGRTRAELRKTGGLSGLAPDFGPRDLSAQHGATLVGSLNGRQRFHDQALLDVSYTTLRTCGRTFCSHWPNAPPRPPELKDASGSIPG